MYVHACTHVIYIYVSVCFLYAEISVLYYSHPQAGCPVLTWVCLTGLDVKPTCSTLTTCVLQSMMMLGKHTYRPISNCMLSVDLPANLPD